MRAAPDRVKPPPVLTKPEPKRKIEQSHRIKERFHDQL